MTVPVMTVLERVTRVLEIHRVNGGWIDEIAALAVLTELGLNEDGEPVATKPTHTSSNLGHG